MGVLTCGCLNVSVHYKGSVWKEKSLSSSHIFPEDTVDPLMNQPLYEIELDVAGIVVVSTAHHYCSGMGVYLGIGELCHGP